MLCSTAQSAPPIVCTCSSITRPNLGICVPSPLRIAKWGVIDAVDYIEGACFYNLTYWLGSRVPSSSVSTSTVGAEAIKSAIVFASTVLIPSSTLINIVFTNLGYSITTSAIDVTTSCEHASSASGSLGSVHFFLIGHVVDSSRYEVDRAPPVNRTDITCGC